jgi:hypothetical protein
MFRSKADKQRIAELEQENARLTAIVKEWQLDGTKPFEVYSVPLAFPIALRAGSVANVEFSISDGEQEVVVGNSVVPNAPTGVYDRATAFVFTDAFGMKEGFGGAIGKSK